MLHNLCSIDELEQCLRIYSNEVMSTPISWMKILGMIVFSGSLALECIAQELVDHILSHKHALYDMFHIVWSNRTNQFSNSY